MPKPPGKVPDFDRAIESEAVTFEALVGIHHARDREDLSELANEYYVPMYDAFEAGYGRIRKSFFGRHGTTGVALTEDDKIHTGRDDTGKLLPVPCRTLVEASSSTNEDACRLLIGQDRRLSAEQCYSVINRVLDVGERYLAAPDDAAREAVLSELDEMEAAHERAQHFLVQARQRRAQTDYFAGVLVGVPALALLSALVATALAELGAGDESLKTLFACVATGGLGAVVSVLSRMTLGTLALDDTAGSKTVRSLGVIRPFVGAIFAVAVYLMIAGEIVPIEPPSGQEEERLFFAGLGFVAGFSERFAQDMLVGAANVQASAGTPNDSKTT